MKRPSAAAFRAYDELFDPCDHQSIVRGTNCADRAARAIEAFAARELRKLERWALNEARELDSMGGSLTACGYRDVAEEAVRRADKLAPKPKRGGKS